jgi:hypothetical protein
MARQAALFPKPQREVIPLAGSPEPRIWIKRLVLWEEPGNLLRDLTLRRGLNIVWSPDPGTASASPGAEGESGHGAGKSLFCRLLRYCLGEDGFASGELRRAIIEKYPKGIVGAEISVGGRVWSVTRPMGIGRKTVVGEGPVEDLLVEGVHRTGMAPLIAAITDELRLAELDESMPTTAIARSWLLALAWLSRDQDARFSHLLDWRHPRSESGSPASGLSREDGVVAVRLLLNAFTAAELDARTKLEVLIAEMDRLETDIVFHQRTADQLFERLAAIFQQGQVGGPLTTSSLADRARVVAEAARREVEDAESERELLLREQIESVVRDRAVLEKQQSQSEAVLDIQRQQLGFLRGERANLDAAEIKARLGPMCPVCSVPIDEALAQGCGLSHALPDRESILTEKARTAERIASAQGAIQLYEREQEQRDAILTDLAKQEEGLRANLRRVAEERRTDQRRHRDVWLKAAAAEESVGRLAQAYGQIDSLKARSADAANEKKGIEKHLEAHRETHAATVNRFAELFRYVCAALLGPDAEARLFLTGQGLKAEVRVGGTAMESLKALAFDIAAMLMSIEGRTHLPAFLIHDSPREADLGISHYHRLFRFTRELEDLDQEGPLFQYIVTTTTEPPPELSSEPFVIARLSGTEEALRLLKTTVG